LEEIKFLSQKFSDFIKDHNKQLGEKDKRIRELRGKAEREFDREIKEMKRISELEMRRLKDRYEGEINGLKEE